MRAQYIGTGVFFDQLSTAFVNGQRQQQLIHPQLRLDFDNRFAPLTARRIPLREQAAGANCYVRERALQAVCENVMILGAFIRSERLRRGADTSLVPTRSGSDKGDKKVAACHGSALVGVLRLGAFGMLTPRWRFVPPTLRGD